MYKSPFCDNFKDVGKRTHTFTDVFSYVVKVLLALSDVKCKRLVGTPQPNIVKNDKSILWSFWFWQNSINGS